MIIKSYIITIMMDIRQVVIVNPLAPESIYLAASAECAGPIGLLQTNG